MRRICQECGAYPNAVRAILRVGSSVSRGAGGGSEGGGGGEMMQSNVLLKKYWESHIEFQNVMLLITNVSIPSGFSIIYCYSNVFNFCSLSTIYQ